MRVICEVDGIDETAARELFKLAAYKLPVKTRFVKKGQEAWNQSSVEQEVKR